MPARIVVVLGEPGFGEKTVSALKAVGYDAATLPDSMAALHALEGAVRIEVLVTCLDHGPGKPNGISLACMARVRRPGIKVLFVGDAGLAPHAEGLGAFMASPVEVSVVAQAAIRLLETPDQTRE